MAMDFFEKELKKTQDRFNETFGVLIVCDLKCRGEAIRKIIQMRMLKDTIMRCKNDDEVMKERSKFVIARNWLNNIFNQIEDELEERRNHVNSSNHTKRRSPERSHVAR